MDGSSDDEMEWFSFDGGEDFESGDLRADELVDANNDIIDDYSFNYSNYHGLTLQQQWLQNNSYHNNDGEFESLLVHSRIIIAIEIKSRF